MKDVLLYELDRIHETAVAISYRANLPPDDFLREIFNSIAATKQNLENLSFLGNHFEYHQQINEFESNIKCLEQDIQNYYNLDDVVELPDIVENEDHRVENQEDDSIEEEEEQNEADEHEEQADTEDELPIL
ncbi:unnamed protein product [Caenorhabditis bovis]|uniref:Uncharacterized protein n=1 Tax=Caenorhabditis bovis TaxID=2654633 RepID=A0A8S1FGE0_9PELO|nr:unnamed protein product [Caenorhabditis bovis]